jgi:heterodisulfide reductase subunit A
VLWVHTGDDLTTLKAMQLVASAVAKACYLEPLQVRQVPVKAAAAVIGGGIAGMQAALDLGSAGFDTLLIERAPELGGHAARLHATFPTLESVSDLVGQLNKQVVTHPRIHVMTNSEVLEVGGYVGNFNIKVRNDGTTTEAEVGAIIAATGYQVFDPRRKPELGYGVYPQVITTLDFEALCNDEILINGRQPEKVVFIQCVGSRDQTIEKPYCSRVCCMVTAKQAQLVRQRLPKAQVTVFYMDVRAFGKGFEEFYDQTRESGVLYRRGNPSEIIRRGDKVVVRAEDTLLRMPVEVEADLVVLAVGMAPRADSAEVASLLKLARSGDGFFWKLIPRCGPWFTAIAESTWRAAARGPRIVARRLRRHARPLRLL